MRWTLFILFCLLGAPAHAVAIPGVTTGTSTSQQAAPEPSPEQKKSGLCGPGWRTGERGFT
ncbi:Potassium efflux system KefA protein [Salmonella enterica subsp. enterica]|nr:Potassium efflux system KefA protein [Salmonella enterica subsp. enterica]